MPVPKPFAAAGPVVQVFGLERDQDTRAAIRFFKERRVAISFVDLRKRPIAPAELRRFVEGLGAETLLDRESKPYHDAGLGYLRLDAPGIIERLLADVRLVRLPLVRLGSAVSAGRSEVAWAAWLRLGDGS